MLELFGKAMKGGVRTSEFWLSVAALLLPFADNAAAQMHGTAGVVVGGVVAGAYAISRGMVKAKAVETTAAAAASEAAATFIPGAGQYDQGGGAVTSRGTR
jgi:hypothetical protein